MSIETVNSEISKFLQSNEPAVLCIRGKWGVGKTYNWTKLLEEALKTGKVALPRYSYVSLFGINSIDELKFAIFENVVTLKKGKIRADISTLDEFVNSNVVQWRKITRFVQSLPFVKSLVGSEATTIFPSLQYETRSFVLMILSAGGIDLTLVMCSGSSRFYESNATAKSA